MPTHVELNLRTQSIGGQVWHAAEVVWNRRTSYATGFYRDAAAAREAAMVYVGVLRAHVLEAVVVDDGVERRRVAWRAFAADNPDAVDDVLEQFHAQGEARIGGGAAPLVRVVPAAWPMRGRDKS